MHFLDYRKIWIESGKGGNGCVAFRRERCVPFGGPFGGNGGRGGGVFFKAVNNLNTLSDYRFKIHFFSKNGEPGRGKAQHGIDAEDLELLVPVGTQIFEEDYKTLIADMKTEGQVKQVLRGGRGGYGNINFKTSTNQAPQNAVPGELGRGKWVILSLKTIADIGFIGKPNAGKSTLISLISNASPKIANYPFTTLHPVLGIVRVYDEEFTAVDIPGLIKDASLGKGLGHRFLSHVERCKVLAHLISLEENNLFDSYQEIRNEIINYSSVLNDKLEIIILTKSDLYPDEEVRKKVSLFRDKLGNKSDIIIISSLFNDSIDLCKKSIFKLIKSNEKEEDDSICWRP